MSSAPDAHVLDERQQRVTVLGQRIHDGRRHRAQGDLEIAYGFADQASRASRAELDAIFERLNAAQSA